jgi:hypothetical protein
VRSSASAFDHVGARVPFSSGYFGCGSGSGWMMDSIDGSSRIPLVTIPLIEHSTARHSTEQHSLSFAEQRE